MAEVLFRAKLQRDDPKRRWGFCLQGGADCRKPLTLLQVQAESVAAKGGLLPGDIVVKLAGQSALGMTHAEAQKTIIDAGNSLEIIVERSEEIASPTYAPADLVFPEAEDCHLAVVKAQEGKSKEKTPIESNDRTNGPLMKAPEVISDSSEEPFPVTSILKTSQEGKTTNNHKVKLAGKTVKFLDESPPRRMRRPSPSPVRRRRAPAYTGRKRSSSAPTYTRVRITGRDKSPSSQPEYERKVNIISGTGSPVSETPKDLAGEYKVAVIPPFTKSSDTVATTTTTTTTTAAAAETPVSGSDGDPRYPWRRSRADTARRADIFRQEMAERKAHVQAAQPQVAAKKETPLRQGVVGGTPIAVQHHTLSSSSGLMVNQPNLVSQPQVITSTVSAHIPVIIRPHFTHQHFVLSPLAAQNPLGLGLGSPPDRNTPSPVRVKSPSPTPQQPPVHTVTVAPEVADLPMPAVKEIVRDLNRRLELLAAKQPELTKPLTPSELGSSYLKKDLAGPSSSSSDDSESSVAKTKGDVKTPLSTYQQSSHRPHPAPSPPLRKLYDVSSPVSPPIGRSSPFSPQKKVTFADQLEDFRIIEPRTEETGATLFTTVASPELGTSFDHIKPGVTYQYNVPQRQFGISVTEPESVGAEGPLSPPSQPRPSAASTAQSNVSLSQPKLSLPSASQAIPSSVPQGIVSPQPQSRPTVSVTPSVGLSPTHQRPGFVAPSVPSPVRFTMPLTQPSRQAYHFSISKSGIEVTPKPYVMHPINVQVGSSEPLSLQYSFPPSYADAMYASSQGVKAEENYPGYSSWPTGGMQTRQGLLMPQEATYHRTPAMAAEQARLIRFLDQKMAEGGNAPASLPTPHQQVPQGVAASKPFPQVSRAPAAIPQFVSDSTPTGVVPTGAVPSSPTAMAAAAARALGSAMGNKYPGLIAILDKNFTEKLLQWHQEREGGMEESETYRLVHEMDTQKQKRKDVTDL